MNCCNFLKKKKLSNLLFSTGMKANVSEAEHPLLCESTRKQRGELAIAMLVHYKDDQVKLSKVGQISYQFTFFNIISPHASICTLLYTSTKHVEA